MVVAVPDLWLGVDASANVGVDVRQMLEGHTLVGYGTEADRWCDALHDASVEVLLTLSNRVSKADLAKLPQLRLISVPGTGIGDYIDLPAAEARGVVVCNVREYATQAIAEYTLALILLTAHRIVVADQRLRAGSWNPAADQGFELHGKCAAVVGYGAIGRRVTTLLMALGMRVRVVSRHLSAADLPSGATKHSLYDALRDAVVVTLHAGLDASTRHLIDAAAFRALPSGAILVNTARGALVDTEALLDALSSGRLAGAGLDVFEDEPLLADHPLLSFPQVVVTPHRAGASRDAHRRVVRMAVENIVNYVSGTPSNVVVAKPNRVPGNAADRRSGTAS